MKALLERLNSDLHLTLFFKLLGIAAAAHVIQFMAQQHRRIGSFVASPELWQQVVPISAPDLPAWVAVALHLAFLLLSFCLALFRSRAQIALLLLPVGLAGVFVQPVCVSNHYLVLLLTLLAFPIVVWLANLAVRSAPDAAEAVAATAASGYATAMRHVFLITYFFAAFHKLNTGWFSFEGNSGVRFVQKLLAPVLDTLHIQSPLLLDLAALPIIVFPVLAEFAIPVLLLWPRFRVYGVLLGIGLHLPMFAREILDYPALILTFYPLFFSEAELRRFGDELRNVTAGKNLLAGAAATGVILVWLVIVPVTPPRLFEPTWTLETIFGAGLIAGWAYVGVTLLWDVLGISRMGEGMQRAGAAPE